MKLLVKAFALVCLTALLTGILVQDEAYSQPASPTQVGAVDTPNDGGRSITVRWKLSADDGNGDNNVIGYNILRGTSLDGVFYLRGRVLAETNSYTDIAQMEKSPKYYYIVQAIDATGNLANSEIVGPVKATGEWFHLGKKFIMAALILFSGIVIYYIYRSRRGKEMYVRRISGLEAVDEAIGRATEMGRPILYVPGIGGVSSVATIASMNILGHVAKRAAEYETSLRVPCYDPIVMSVMREIAKTSYVDVGRPDAYKDEDIHFITDSQFAYAAAVDGMMIREKPAAIFLQGVFYAESLILAETGNSVGAIQIAGTTSDAQLPFFITACDYTLIGEELYAASAYLSREPMLLGSIKGQDVGKLCLIGALALGAVLELCGVSWFTTFFLRP